MNFSNERFCIVDIETTGGISKRDKITEIAIIVYHNGEIIETFESLINPERSIPSEITRITGITNQMVEDAPKFYEIAKQILQLTEGCIFVAHNVFFDYNFIKEEFFQLGYTYSRNKLCTVQLSRRHFKGLKSYSLGALIDHFNIPVSNRHRAMEDSKATLNLFVKIIEKIASAKTTEFSLTEVLKENRIPPHLNMSDLAKLPERTGIYYFRDQVGNPVYIGKSKNIKTRLFQHFNDTSLKTKKILDSLYHIDVIETGNELMASLIESREIKKHQPEINKALRKKTHAFLLTAHITHGLYNSFKATEMEWLDSRDEVINHYATRKALTEHIDHLIYKFQLCKKINSQSPDGNPCQAFQLGLCFGACINKETQESYNKRFYEAYHEINKIFKESFYIIAEGRSCDENSVVIVENGYCSYLGYIPKDQLLTNISEMKDYLEIYHGGVETNRMIEFYLKRDQNYKIYYL